MKAVMYVLVFFGFLTLGYVSHADTVAKKHLNTSFDFEDQIVQGKYQYPDEAVTTVENEKELKDLLEVRKDFKDRMKQEATRQ
jgi:uncharacterized protein YdeI (BOF family)